MTKTQGKAMTDDERDALISDRVAAARAARATAISIVDRGLATRPSHQSGDQRRADLVKPSFGHVGAHGQPLTDPEYVSLLIADDLAANPRKGRKLKDRVRAQMIRQRIEHQCEERAEGLAVDERMGEVGKMSGATIVQAAGYLRLPKHDGLFLLFSKGHLTRRQLLAGWMYRQLYIAEVLPLRGAGDIEVGGGGAADEFVNRAVKVYDKLSIGRVFNAVLNSAPDGVYRAVVLEVVARHGLPLRAATGGGKAWETGLGRLCHALSTVAERLIDEGLDTGEQ